jgi:hypothetical protein
MRCMASVGYLSPNREGVRSLSLPLLYPCRNPNISTPVFLVATKNRTSV